MDPQCADWFPNETFKNSLLDMRGDGNLIHALKDVPHGSVDYLNYWSPELGMFIPVIVYTNIIIEFDAVSFFGFSSCNWLIAFSPSGVAALSMPSILAARFIIIEPLTG